MKRILPLLLSLCMILALAACGHGDEESSAEEVLTGTVRYMNSDPALQESWQRIAEAYTEEEISEMDIPNDWEYLEVPENEWVAGCTYIIYSYELDGRME